MSPSDEWKRRVTSSRGRKRSRNMPVCLDVCIARPGSERGCTTRGLLWPRASLRCAIMRDHGRLLLRLTHVLGLTSFRETVVLPAIADMQHECGAAESGKGRAWVIARGYWSIVAASAFYAAFLPARYVREDWAGRNAPGPRLLRKAWPASAVLAALLVGIPLATWPNEQGRLGPGIMALLLPGMIVSAIPIALAMGVGWALARDRSGSRAALFVGMLGAGLTFAFFDVAVTRANQEYRVASYQARTGRRVELRKGSREMTLQELGTAAMLADVVACPQQGAGCSCARDASPTALRVEWHNRLSIPALGLSFMMLAVALSRGGRRTAVVPGLFLTYGAAFWVLRFGETHAIDAEVPVVLAAWSPHLLPLMLALVLSLVLRNRISTPSPPQGVQGS